MCKRGKETNHQINPRKRGYAHTTISVLKMINFNLKNIKDWEILGSGATRHCLDIDISAIGISLAENLSTTTKLDGSKSTSTHKQELDLQNYRKWHVPNIS